MWTGITSSRKRTFVGRPTPSAPDQLRILAIITEADVVKARDGTKVGFDMGVFMFVRVDKNGQPVEAEDLRFRNSKSSFVELHPYDPYAHM